MDNETAERWVTIQQASGLLNKSERTIRRWVETDKLAHRKEGRRIYVNVAELVPPEPEPEPDVDRLIRQVYILQAEVDILTAEVENLRSLVDRQDGEISFLRSALASALRLQQTAIEQPEQPIKERRSWWPPWGSGED